MVFKVFFLLADILNETYVSTVYDLSFQKQCPRFRSSICLLFRNLLVPQIGAYLRKCGFSITSHLEAYMVVIEISHCWKLWVFLP